MKKAVIQYAIAKYSTVIINLVITSILSRILIPSDYGIIAVVMVFINLFNIFSTLGIGTGVIQNQDLKKDEIEGIFSTTVWISLIIWIVFIGLSFIVSKIYQDVIYVNIMCWLSPSVLLMALNVVPNAVILKEQRYREIAFRMILGAGISGVVAIIVALNGGKYYALVVQNILNSLIQFCGNQYSVRIKFRLKANMQGVRKIANYSMFQFLYSLCLAVSQNLDNLLTAKMIGSEQLAYYNKGYTLMRYPIDYIPHTLSPVLHPILAQHQNELAHIYIEYIKLAKLVSLIATFCSLIFILEAKEIICFLFGTQWENSVPIVQIFGIGLWFQMINALAGAIYQSSNATKNMFFSGCIHITCSIVAIIIGVMYGNIEILALALTISWIIKFIVESIFLVKLSLKQSVLKYWKNFMIEFLMFGITLGIGSCIFKQVINSFFISILYKSFIIVLVYGLLCLIFRKTKYFRILFRKK